MSTGTSGLKSRFEQVSKKVANLNKLRDDEKADIPDYIDCVDELSTSWESFEKSMKDKIKLEDVLEKALSSYDEKTKSYDEELRKAAVDTINDEIDRLREQISNLVQIHNFDI